MASCRKYCQYIRKTKSEAAEVKEWVCLYLGNNNKNFPRLCVACHESGFFPVCISQLVLLFYKIF